jgi:hypothetical protein
MNSMSKRSLFQTMCATGLNTLGTIGYNYCSIYSFVNGVEPDWRASEPAYYGATMLTQLGSTSGINININANNTLTFPVGVNITPTASGPIDAVYLYQNTGTSNSYKGFYITSIGTGAGNVITTSSMYAVAGTPINLQLGLKIGA